jgi:ubiquinone/menaquinone biosynthesis C-methylase UbiE
MEYKQSNSDLINSFDKLEATYDEETNDFTHKIIDYIHMENLTIELPPPKNEIKLLDLGGGTGKYSVILSKLGYNITLLDISKESIKVAEEKFKQNNLHVTTINSSGENIPFEDNFFDVILMVGCVINYTPNPERMLIECKRVLKSNGIMYFDFSNNIGQCNEINDIKFRIELAEADEKLIKMDDWDYPMRGFNYKRMEQLLENKNFKIKSKYGLINLTTSLPMKFRYGNDYDENILEKYKKMELQLSREKECYGTSLCCIIVIQK